MIENLTWSNYFLCRNESFIQFWELYLSDSRDMLFLLAKGFDPRMPILFQTLVEMGQKGRRDVVILPIEGSQSIISANNERLVESNIKSVNEAIKRAQARSSVSVLDSVPTITRTNLDDLLLDNGLVNRYDDIIIDISSFPRTAYYILIDYLLSQTSEDVDSNLHVAVNESPEIDNLIMHEGIAQQAMPISGFSAGVARESLKHLPLVWFPVLGEKRENHMNKIVESHEADEVCPILPILSQDVRRADKLIRQYSALFEEYKVDPRNVILASETNPFDLYRSIVQASIKFQKAFVPFDGCRIMISPLSSKLLNVGALLAAYELRNKNYDVGVVHAPTLSYGIEKIDEIQNVHEKCSLTSLWLRGDCYTDD